MKTAYGKLFMLALIAIVGILLFAPMRAGREDVLSSKVNSLVMNIGDTYAITYSISSERAQTVSFSSSNTAVATVDPMGVITATGSGKAKIKLRASDGATDTVSVSVNGEPVTEITLNTSELVLEKGTVSGLTCEFNKEATDHRVEWLSADPTIATVDEGGRVAALNGGETYIIANTPSGNTATAKVRVIVPSTSVSLAPDDLTIGVGASFPLQITCIPEDATDEPVKWETSDASVFTVSSSGTVHALSAGTATVRVTTELGKTAEMAICVEPSADLFRLSPTAMTIDRGAEYDFDAWFADAVGERVESNHTIAWTSDNPACASIDNGHVVALASGTANITASADGETITCRVRVITPVRSVTLNWHELYLYKEQTGEKIQLTATVLPEDADDTTVIWTSNNTQVANVTETGEVTFTGGYGTATITAAVNDGLSDTFTVSVVATLPQTDTDTETTANADKPSFIN